MHIWGDDWKWWKELYDAQQFIYKYTYRWSLCRLCSKEKYGTIRYEFMFPPFSGIFYNHWYSRWWISSKLHNLWARFGWYICGKAIKKALKKWPQLEKELCSDFLANTKFGRECEDKYWTKL